MKPRRSTPSCADGLTLIELMVGMTITLGIGAVALSLALGSRNVFDTDRDRMSVNQNLRNGADMLGIDLRQAGERLPADFPAVLLANGSGNLPDRLTVRRNVLPEILPLCQDIVSGTSENDVVVAISGGGGPAGCDPVPDDDGDGWPENLGAWRAHRIIKGGAVFAFLFNPVSGDGEFFAYDGEDAPGLHLHRASGTGSWLFDYPAADMPRIYMLEQHTYRVMGGVLQAVLNGDGNNPINLVAGLTDFQVVVLFQNGTTQTSMTSADDWTDLQAIEIMLTGSATTGDVTVDRSLTTRYFPRNVLSR